MLSDLDIPEDVPVMTLGGVVLFPQALIPLHIFEPRYRLMLKEVLESNRIFALATLDEPGMSPAQEEPVRKIAGIGIVRACRTNPDGTSNLILQGLARVEFAGLVSEHPFRRMRIHPFPSEQDGSAETLAAMRTALLGLIQNQLRLDKAVPKEILDFLSQTTDPETTLDLAIHTLGTSAALKQELLETRGILARFEKFERFLRARIERLKIEKALRKGLADDGPGLN